MTRGVQNGLSGRVRLRELGSHVIGLIASPSTRPQRPPLDIIITSLTLTPLFPLEAQ